MMKTSSIAILCLLLPTFFSFTAEAAGVQVVKSVQADHSGADSTEEWKGTPEDSEMMFGALTGLGIVDGDAGYAILGTISKKIVKLGFVEDLANSVSVELQGGPVFLPVSSVFAYGAHLRWDFQRNQEWTIYAIGGVSGSISGTARGNRFEFFPRFGVGALWDVFSNVLLRGELSHELVALGVAIPVWF